MASSSPYMHQSAWMNQPSMPANAAQESLLPAGQSSSSTANYLYRTEQKIWPYVWLFLSIVLMILLVALGIWILTKVFKDIKLKKKQKRVEEDLYGNDYVV